MFSNVKIISLSVILIFYLNIISAQKFGKPFVKNYTTKDYNAETQNWCIKQDKNNFIYVGNNEGLLEYDGVSWRKILLSNNSVVRSIDIDENNNVYIGGSSEFGYLKSNQSGKLEYISISSLLDTSQIKFTDIWQVMCLEKAVAFRSSEKLFIVPYFEKSAGFQSNDTSKIKIFSSKSKFYSAYFVQKNLYIIDKALGLCLVYDDTIKVAENGTYFKTNIPFSILPYSADTLICGIYRAGLVKYNSKDGNIIEIETDAYYLLKENRIYKGEVLTNGNYAYATLGGGVIIVDKNGKFINQVDEHSGIKDDVVGYIYNDKGIGLWLATNTALSKVEIESPVTYWDSENGIESTIEDCILFKDKIYISNINGIQFLENEQFISVESIYNSQGWKFQNFVKGKDTVLLYGNGVGAFEFNGIVNKSIIDGTNFRTLYISKIYKNLIYFGSDKGLSIISTENLKYGQKSNIEDYNFINFSSVFDYQSDFITEDSFGNIWIFSEYEGVFKISPKNVISQSELNFNEDSLEITKFDETSGIPSLIECKIYSFDNELIVTSTKGICVFDYQANKFLPYSKFENRYSDKNFKIRFFEKDYSENLWIGFEIGQNAHIDVIQNYKSADYVIDSLSLNRLPDMKLTEIFFSPGNDFVLVSGSEGLFRINSDFKNENIEKPNIFIRKITLNEDSVLFWGNPQLTTNLHIDYEFNNIKFEFASPFYIQEQENLYSYYLENFDDEWSTWSVKTEKEYTNLKEGKYIFKVKAKNIYEQESIITEYIFSIRPPWYRTIFAYLFYIICGIIIIVLIVKIYLRRLINEKIKLENIVSERTKEISTKNIELQNQKEEILSQAEKLEQINSELEKLSIVASETDNAIIIADKFGNFEWLNNGFTRLYGYNFNEYTEKFKNVTEATTNKEFCNIFNKCINEKQSVSYESFIITKSGEIIWAQSTITPVLNINGEISKLVIIDTDISKLKNAEMEIMQKNEEITVQKEVLERQNEEIIKHRDELEEKNIKINIQTDSIKGSIRSAETIQMAILPEQDELSKYFENFIIYRPKDIVSGDFYWFTIINDLIFLAVVDCTGHGVPGAFMSMIGSRLLNEIVNQKHIFSPKDVLNELNYSIIKALKQDKTDNKDGMDICLIKIEDISQSKKLMTYTGAKLDLFYYSSENNQINRIKGDRKTIGGVFLNNSKVEFTNTVVNLNKNDIVYLFTDGFIDQNNAERKRFGSAALHNILVDICSMPMDYQKKTLELEIDKWMNGIEQRDDVTVLSIKI